MTTANQDVLNKLKMQSHLLRFRPHDLMFYAYLTIFRAVHIPWRHLYNFHVSTNVRIGKDCKFIRDFSPLEIGPNCTISDRCTIECGPSSPVTINEGCIISHNCNLIAAMRNTSSMLGYKFQTPIWIGNECRIGCGSTILGGATLGARCVVGANSVVTKCFGEGETIAGSPARKLRSNI